MTQPKSKVIRFEETELGKKASAVTASWQSFNNLTERSHKALYETIAHMVGFARLTLTREYWIMWRSMCEGKDLNPLGDNKNNKYLNVVKVLIGDKDGKAAPAVYKYAKAVRYFMDQRTDEDEIVDIIETFSFKGKTKLDGIYAADSEANPDTRGSSENGSRTIATVKKTYANTVLGSFTTDASYTEVDDLVVMLGQDTGNGIDVKAFFGGDVAKLARLIAAFKPEPQAKEDDDSPWAVVAKAAQKALEEEAA